jgi:hypothetical protein
LHCDGSITIDGTVYEPTLSTSDSSIVFIGNRTLSDTTCKPLAGVNIIVCSGTITNEQITNIVDNSSLNYTMSDNNGVYHYYETSYPGKETCTIIFWKKGYKSSVGSFYKNQAYVTKSIFALLVKDTVIQ